MKTTVEALQELYIARGGSLTDTYEDIANGVQVGNYVAIPDMISAISRRIPAAESYLPIATSVDNGKVLKVVSGKWDLATDNT